MPLEITTYLPLCYMQRCLNCFLWVSVDQWKTTLPRMHLLKIMEASGILESNQCIVSIFNAHISRMDCSLIFEYHLSLLLLYNKLPQIQFKKKHIYYLTASMGQESGHSLGCPSSQGLTWLQSTFHPDYIPFWSSEFSCKLS